MDKDTGTIVVLMERLEKQRLPRIFSMQEKVDAGEPLGDMDLDYLEKVMADAKRVIVLAEKHPEYQLIVSKVIELYNDITEKALKIENNS